MELNEKEKMEMQLWSYIDGSFDAQQQQRVAALIASDKNWEAKFNELSALHMAMTASFPSDAPSLRFSKNVMEDIGNIRIAPPAQKYINIRLIKGIAASFIVALTIALGLAFASADWHTTTRRTATFPGFLKYDLSGLFDPRMFHIIITINVIVALLFMDAWLRHKRIGHNS
jgi:hypothetical protein